MEEKQIIEVEYDEALVEEFKKNYIMEEEGVGADQDSVEPYATQTNTNEVPFEEMIEEGEVIIEEVEEDDSNN